MSSEETDAHTITSDVVHNIPSGIAFCSLCNKYVSPKSRNFIAPSFLTTTSLAGLGITLFYGRQLGDDSGHYSGLAESTLGALIEFAFVMFAVLLIGSVAYLLFTSLQKERCPICNTRI